MTVKGIIVLLFFTAPSLICFSQINNKDEFPLLKDKKGGLIFINEAHGAPSNTLAYIAVLKSIHTQLQQKDTINLFLEIPYSRAVMINNCIVNGVDRSIPIQHVLYADFIDSIVALKIPIKVFGCDFEYDPKYKQGASFAYLLENFANKIQGSKVDIEPLKKYFQLVKEYNISSKDTKQVIVWLKEISPKLTDQLRQDSKQVLFALEAPQEFKPGRDEDIFERALKGIELGYFNYKNRFNVLIHGISHIDPTYNSTLFNLFRRDKESPFNNNCYIIANLYLECKYNTGIFKHEYTADASLYVSSSKQQTILNYYRNLSFQSGNIYFLLPPQDLTFPGLREKELIGVYVHNKIIN